MPKTYWTCDLCGRAHKTEEKAVECEAHHPHIVLLRAEFHETAPGMVKSVVLRTAGETKTYRYTVGGANCID